MTELQKLQQIKKEAFVTGIALVVLIIFWYVAGFCVSALDITIFHLPLWSVTGTVGVWMFGMILVWFLLRFFFKDMDLEESKEEIIS